MKASSRFVCESLAWCIRTKIHSVANASRTLQVFVFDEMSMRCQPTQQGIPSILPCPPMIDREDRRSSFVRWRLPRRRHARQHFVNTTTMTGCTSTSNFDFRLRQSDFKVFQCYLLVQCFGCHRRLIRQTYHRVEGNL